MTVQDVFEKLDSWGFSPKLNGDGNRVVVGFSDPKDYLPDTMIWVGKVEDINTEKVKYEDIALVLAKEDSGATEVLPNVITLGDPRSAFMNLVYYSYAPEKIEYIDETASVSPKATIGQNCYIGRNAIIEEGAIIGDGCVIKENVFIGKDCVIGAECDVGQNTVIGGDLNGSVLYDLDGVMRNMPNIGRAIIGNAVLIGAGSLIARGTFSDTVIGDECMLNAGTAIGHNCKVGKRCLLLGRCTISGNVKIGEGCQLISAAVKNRITIGDNVKVGIGSVVLKDIPDNKTVFGNPARVMPG